MSMTYYILKSWEVLKNRPTPLVLLCLVNVILSFRYAGNSGMIIEGVILLVAYPLIYGRYAELLQGNPQISYRQILRKHWLNFFLVNLVLSMFFLLVALIGSSLITFQSPAQLAAKLIFDIIKVYMIPLVFLMNTGIACISSGLRYLIDHITFSIPLMLITLVPAFLEWTTHNMGLEAGASFNAFLGNAFFTVCYISLNLLVFITATLVLRDELGIVDQEVR